MNTKTITKPKPKSPTVKPVTTPRRRTVKPPKETPQTPPKAMGLSQSPLQQYLDTLPHNTIHIFGSNNGRVATGFPVSGSIGGGFVFGKSDK